MWCNTGVVTSVPSDSPDDYTALNELKAKPKLREKFSVEDAWVDYEVCHPIHFPPLSPQAVAFLSLVQSLRPSSCCSGTSCIPSFAYHGTKQPV